MKKSLQDQYQLIKEGKGHKGSFLAEVKRSFPLVVRNAATFEEATRVLKDKNIISENIVGIQAINQLQPTKKLPFEIAFENFLKEAKKKEVTDKAEVKKPVKQVEEKYGKTYDNKDMKNIDNLIFDQVMTGYYAEMKDPKNADKTMEELKEIVMKNLAKDPIHYTKDGQFGVKELGYSVEHPGLGEPKEPKGKYKASGYGDLKEAMYQGPVIMSPKKPRPEPKGEPKENTKYLSFPDGVMRSLIEKGYIIIDENGVFISGRLKANLNKLLTYETASDIKTFLSSNVSYSPNITPKTNIYTGTKEQYTQVIPSNGVEIRSNKIPSFTTNEEGVEKMDVPVDSKLLFQVLITPEIWRTFTTKSEKFEENISINESKLRGAIRSIIAEEMGVKPLNENLPKRLKEIENESVNEVKVAKLDKLKAEIEKRQSQLDMIENNEDLKELTDKNKIKSLHKEIKLLERAMAKLEKTIKGTKKEVIDETEGGLDDPKNPLEGGPDDPNNPYDKSENYDVAKRELEIWLDRIDDGTLDADIIEDKIDTYLSNTSGAWLEVPEDQIPILKQDLITKYLGTDND